MKPLPLIIIAAAVLAACLSALGGDGAPSLDAAVGRIRTTLEHVAEADRELDAAKVALSRSAARAKVFYGHAERLFGEKPSASGPEADEIMRQVVLGTGELLRGIEQTERHLSSAADALEQAANVRDEADRMLASVRRRSSQNVREARELLETMRRQVQSRWDHAHNPALGHDREARTTALALVERQMSLAAGQWQALLGEEAKLQFINDRQTRLSLAARRLARRRADIEALGEALAAFRRSLLNPLAAPPQATPLERLPWPGPLRNELAVPDEGFQPPRPYQMPGHWTLRDRVRRFTRGGAP